MAYRTLEATLYPDGKLTLGRADLPDRPTRVMVTLLEEALDADLTEPGDYLQQLESYEDRLARGEIRWQ